MWDRRKTAARPNLEALPADPSQAVGGVVAHAPVWSGCMAFRGIVGEFYDAAVSGADPVSDRCGFAQMLERL